MSEEALQIAEKRKDTKGKGEKERYSHLNAEFQRIARRHKKAFLSDQGKAIEEINKTGKTRDLKKIRDTKGIFHVMMGSVVVAHGLSCPIALESSVRSIPFQSFIALIFA